MGMKYTGARVGTWDVGRGVRMYSNGVGELNDSASISDGVIYLTY